MDSIGIEVVVELLPTVLYALAGTALTAGGIVAEYASVQHFGGGDVTVAAWLAVLGLIMLYAGVYGIGYQKLHPALGSR